MSTEPRKNDYRRAAGAVVFNKKGQVFLGRRKNAVTPHVWQFPQGGMDRGETHEEAALRELHEETGISPALITKIGEIEEWLYYDFPTQFKHSEKSRGKKGQRQRWFAFLFHGDDKDVDVDAHKPVEFSDWRWGSLEEAYELIVPFKREVYARLACEFAGFSKPRE